jgi:hypothetical protein
MGEHFSDRGYVCVFLQHPGSDDSVWRNVGLRERMQAMNAAANLENFLLRVNDVPAVIDQLETWNAESGHELESRLDVANIGMSGIPSVPSRRRRSAGRTFRWSGRATMTSASTRRSPTARARRLGAIRAMRSARSAFPGC